MPHFSANIKILKFEMKATIKLEIETQQFLVKD